MSGKKQQKSRSKPSQGEKTTPAEPARPTKDATADATSGDAPTKLRFLSGVQPSGKLHLGNYFGAIKQHIELQDEGECFYFIANYHALTTVRDRERMLALTRDVALDYLALGLDPERTTFYRQSDVPEVTELTWLLATVTGMGLLERAHSYKDKVAKGLSPDAGLFIYPLLMAADILAPQSDVVPVGQDQKQHLEMTRDIAAYFNNTYKRDVFKIPEYRESETPKVPGTTYDILTRATVMIRGRILKSADLMMAVERAIGDRFIEGETALRLSEEAIRSLEVGLARDIRNAVSGLVDGATDVQVMFTKEGVEQVAEPVQEMSYRSSHSVVVSIHPVEPESGARRPAKMSKSYKNTIDIFAEGKALKKQVMRIVTDPTPLDEPIDLGDSIVMEFYRMFATKEEADELAAKYAAGGFGHGNAKKALFEKIDAFFAPAREKRRELEADPSLVDDILAEGAKRARAVARETLDAARDACGLA